MRMTLPARVSSASAPPSSVVQFWPPSPVRSSAVQRSPGILKHSAVPRAQPSRSLTNVRSATWNAFGTGPPAGPCAVAPLDGELVVLCSDGAGDVTGGEVTAAALVRPGVGVVP